MCNAGGFLGKPHEGCCGGRVSEWPQPVTEGRKRAPAPKKSQVILLCAYRAADDMCGGVTRRSHDRAADTITGIAYSAAPVSAQGDKSLFTLTNLQ